MAVTGSANRDPERFEDPDTFDPCRGNLREHLAFGHGEHFCIGSHLARLELKVIFEEILKRVRNPQFIRAWQQRVVLPAGLEHFTISVRQPGPPGRDVNVRLTGRDALTLKQAALDLASSLETIPGVFGVEDDMPFGREQLIYELTPAGEALGLTTAELGRQLRTAFEGRLVQIFQDGPDEVEVRVQLPEQERDLLSTLGRVNIRTTSGDFVPLMSVARWHAQQGFQAVRHAAGPDRILKVIIETCLLTDDEKVKACEIAQNAGADFVKTSTGFSSGGAIVEDVALMRRIVGPEMGVKASGGIKDWETAVAMIEAGADRLGTSSGVVIVESAPD